MSSPVCQDAFFGPAVSAGCRGGLDFTVLFEEAIMSILPSACFLLFAPVQASRVFRRANVVVPSLLHAAKLVAILLYAGLQLVLLIFATSPSQFKTQLSLASAALSLFAVPVLAFTSHLAHTKSPRPSFFLSAYLFISLLLEAARARTNWLLGENTAVAAVLTASAAVKLGILLLEARDKRSILAGAHAALSREATSGLFSRGFFWWLTALLRDGWRRSLEVGALPTVNEKLASGRLVEELGGQWAKGKPDRQHGLALAAFWVWRLEFVKIALPRLVLVALNLAQPFLIQNIASAVDAVDGEASRSHSYALVAAIALMYMGIAVATAVCQHLSFRLTTMIRGGLIVLIYQKVLETPSAAVGDSAAMSLIGTDVERICETWYLVLLESWASALQLGVAVWLLERQLGAVCVAPVILVLVATAMSFKAATYVGARQRTWLEAIQERINFTAHILGSIKAVKMLGLGERFETSIQRMRIRELALSKKFRRLSSFNVCLVNLPTVFSHFLTFATFAIAAQLRGSDSFSVTQAVTTLSVLTVLMTPLSMLLVAIPQGYAALSCFDRIQDFLANESWRETRTLAGEEPSGEHTGDDVQMASLTCSLDNALPGHLGVDVKGPEVECVALENATIGRCDASPVIRNATFRITTHTPLTVILGPIGCGKSTLLKAMLGEALVLGGTIRLATRQVAFCDQTPWVFAGSVRSNILGEAAFEQDWYATVVHACALDTDFNQLSNGDTTAIGSKGSTLSGGQKQRITMARALYARKRLALFDDVLSGLDAATQELIVERVFGPRGLLRRTGTTAVLAGHMVKHISVADHFILLDSDGRILQRGPTDSLELPQLYTREPAAADQMLDNPYSVARARAPDTALTGQAERQTGDLSVYKYYLSSLGWLSTLAFGSFVAANSVFGTVQYAWLALWSESNGNAQQTGRLGYWLGLFGLFGLLKAFFLVASVYYMYVVIVPRSAKKLHLAVLRAVMGAPMSFLSRTDTGELVNRFSQDMQLVDMALPGALVNACFQLAGCLAIAVLAIVASSYTAALMPFLGVALYFLQRFYLRTSRQLRLLELERKAPLYTHVLESLDGLAHIRAFDWTAAFRAKSHALLDTAQRPYYLLLCIQRWLTLVLGLMVAAFATVLTATALAARGRVNAGFLGIALVNMMDFSESLAHLVTYWTTLETSLGAIARIRSFSAHTPREEADADAGDAAPLPPPSTWPATGALAFSGWSVKYDDALAIRDVTFSVVSGENVAICGRTGSGKSSLIASVLGMVDSAGGRITLDNVDLSHIPKRLLREKVTCVTQDAFLFRGSVRANADPLSVATDAAIAAAMAKVGLWAVLERLAGGEGRSPADVLDTPMDENVLSHGQRQLFCLGRALLRKNPLVILDEPTGSVDAMTEARIHAIIESDFQHCSVLMVTHRLAGILGFDKIAVLDNGVLVQYGTPAQLLADGDGALAKLYATQQGKQRTGHDSDSG